MRAEADIRRLMRLLPLVLLLSGCVRIDIGDRTSTPTLGEEIMDLYEARKAGVISPSEYEKAREKLLKIW